MKTWVGKAWKWIKGKAGAIGAVIVSIVGVVVIFFAVTKQNREYVKEAKRLGKEREDEIKRMSASDVVDNELDNTADVRAAINRGRDRFDDRARSALSRLSRSGVRKRDNPGSPE